MADIKVIVIHPTDGRQLTITVENDMTGSEFINNLLEADFLSATSDGYKIAIKGGGEIGENDTLESMDVVDGTALRIIPATDAGV